MEKESDSPAQTNVASTILPLVLAGLTAYWGYVTFHKPVNSPRPAEDLSKRLALVGSQFVPARLWEDPFDPALAESASQDERTTPQSLREQITRKTENASGHNVKILLVMLEGHAYAEDKEVRRRLRYSVQQSLASLGYFPDDRNNLGLLDLLWPSEPTNFTTSAYFHWLDCGRPGLQASRALPFTFAASISSNEMGQLAQDVVGQRPAVSLLKAKPDISLEVTIPATVQPVLHVPFEWFGSASTNSPLLVMWCAEEAFEDFPLERLGLVFDTLFIQNAEAIHSITVLGPRSSNTLGAMANARLSRVFTDQLPALLSKLAVYSCQATVPDYILLHTQPGHATNSILKRPLLRKTFNTLLRRPLITDGISLDDELATLLVQELANRQLCLSSPQATAKNAPNVDQVVLFFESDTVYGRSLALLVGTALRKTYANQSFSEAFATEVNAVAPLPHVHPIPYLRGLDGTKAGASEPVEEASTAQKRLSRFEKPEGDHQVDYVRRAARSLLLANDNEIAQGQAGPIKAVGILGSDVYDKLILLQVLREVFPDAVFFTTDLDDRLLNRDEQDWTRNLIVASSFPLTADSLGPLIFRDAYQTAMYRACRAAVAGQFPYVPPAQLYEIGRTRAFPLLSDPGTVHQNNISALQRFMRTHYASVRWTAGLGALIAGFCLMLLLRSPAEIMYQWLRLEVIDKSSSRRLVKALTKNYRAMTTPARHAVIRQDQMKKKRWMRLVSLITMVLLIILSTRITFLDKLPNEEPFAWLEGVSIWPSELVRLLTIGFSIGAIFWAYWTYHTRLYDIFRKYHLKMSLLSTATLDKNRKLFFCRVMRYLKFHARLSSQGAGRLGVGRFLFLLRLRLTGLRIAFVRWHQEWSITKWPASAAGVEAAQLFVQYQEKGMLRCRVKRVALFTVAFTGFAFSLFLFFGFPAPPLRGGHSANTDCVMLIAAVAMIVLLIAYVADVTRLTERFVRRLGDGKTVWPDALLDEYQATTGLPRTLLSGVIDVDFVADHTKNVNTAAYLPFFAITLMLISRSPFFDRWPWPLSLKLIFAVYVLIAWTCAWAIRSRARKVREEALAELEKHLVNDPATSQDDRIQRAVKRIKDRHTGAYGGWWQEPSLMGLLIPSGGAGAFSMIKALLAG